MKILLIQRGTGGYMKEKINNLIISCDDEYKLYLILRFIQRLLSPNND